MPERANLTPEGAENREQGPFQGPKRRFDPKKRPLTGLLMGSAQKPRYLRKIETYPDVTNGYIPRRGFVSGL